MVSLTLIWLIIKIIGAASSVLAFIFGVFKVINWVKNKFINIDANVTSLKSTMENGFKNLSDDINKQTSTIAGELKEQRQDFRTFYAPILMMQQMQQQPPLVAPVRAKRAPRKNPVRKKK